MADQSRWDARSGRLCFVAAGVFASVVLTGAPAPAQDIFGIFGGARYWFEENARPPRVRPAPREGQRIRRLMPHRQFAKPTIWHERPSPAERLTPPAEHAKPAAKPDATKPDATKPDARPDGAVDTAGGPAPKPFVVTVIGDNLAQWLAVGLAEAFPASSGVSIVNKSRDSSGLVRDDFYDWPKTLRDLTGKTPAPDAIVVMIGSNDRQPLRGAGGAEDPLSKGWEAIYAKRIETLVAIAKEKKIPVLWVGMPVMKSERFSADIGAINEIDRAHAESAGATFINVFDAFADEKGAYSAFGPDVNGQIVKLRTGDGIHFTAPGARKLAHFVEGDLRRLLEAARPAPPVAALPTPTLAVPPAGESVFAPAPPAVPDTASLPAAPEPPPERPAAGPVVPLTAAPVSPGGELLGKPGGRLTDAQRATVETLVRSR